MLEEFAEVEIRERNGWAEAIAVLLARLVMENDRRAQLLAPFALGAAFLLVPFALAIERLVPTDFLTTGYVAVARK